MRVVKMVALVVMGVLLTTCAFAEVTSDVVKTDIDDNGNIQVWAIHSIDGVEVESRYEKIDGHSVYCTRYSKRNFEGLNKKEVEDYILADIQNHTENLVQKEFDKKAPKTWNKIQKDYNAEANDKFAKQNLDELVGRGVSVNSVTKKIDSDNDGVLDKEITLGQNGTTLTSNITTP